MGSGKKASSLIMSMSEQSVMSIQVCLPSGRYIDDPFQTLQNAAKQQHSRLFMNGAGHYRYSDDAAVQAPNDAQGNPLIPDVAGKGYIILKTINGVPRPCFQDNLGPDKDEERMGTPEIRPLTAAENNAANRGDIITMAKPEHFQKKYPD